MLVKTRLQINVAVPVMTALVIVLVLFLTLSHVKRAVEESDLAREITTSAFERSTLRSDYLRTDNERAKKQWFVKHEQMDGLLKSALEKFKAAEDRKIIEELIKDQVQTKKIFSALVQNREKARTDEDSAALSQETESRLANQLQMRLYEKVLNARRLHEAAGRRLFSAFILAGAAIIGVILIAAAAAMISAWTMSRTIAHRIERLRHGASVIGGGNLEHLIDTGHEDEFAELARAFNHMTVKLHSSYLELENEIVERKRAEEELRQSEDQLRTLNENLEMRVAQRTEELDNILAEQEAQNAELQEAYHELEVQTTERIRVMEELRQKEQLLIQQSRLAAMGEMIGFIAHQWRQPLNNLGLIVQELSISYKRGKFTQEYLDDNTAEAMRLIGHMSRTIDDFRNFFKPAKGKVPFSINDVLAKTIKLVEANFRETDLRIDVSAPEDVIAEGYPNEFSQVLLNILLNARDVCLERKVEQSVVAIRIFKERDKAVLTIADNAGGIPEQLMDRIFDPYFTTKGPDRGTGLGLYMAKTIIEKNMNGLLSVRNTGDGAEFRIEI